MVVAVSVAMMSKLTFNKEARRLAQEARKQLSIEQTNIRKSESASRNRELAARRMSKYRVICMAQPYSDDVLDNPFGYIRWDEERGRSYNKRSSKRCRKDIKLSKKMKARSSWLYIGI